jgi:hypothetical protein
LELIEAKDLQKHKEAHTAAARGRDTDGSMGIPICGDKLVRWVEKLSEVLLYCPF